MYNQFMKLVIQIPCFNEQDTILEVLNSIPKKIDGIDEIKVFVVDDASDDRTFETAYEFGVETVKHKRRLGLAQAFKTGVKFALNNRADILVNIDGDNQYNANDIEKLITPILLKKADMTIVSRGPMR